MVKRKKTSNDRLQSSHKTQDVCKTASISTQYKSTSTPHLQDTYNFGQHIFTNIRAVKESSTSLMTDLFHALLATS